MATTVPTAPAVPAPSLAAIQANARARLDAAAAAGGGEPTPTPAPAAPATPAAAPAPAPAAAAPAPPAQPAAAPSPASPGSPPGTPPASITIDVSKLTPEAKRFLEMHGNDPAAALAKGLEYNNRLGHRGDAAAPAPGAPAPTEPAAAPTPAPAAPPPQPTPEQLEQQFQQALAQRVNSDTDLTKYVDEYVTRTERAKVLGQPLSQGGDGEIAKTERAIIGAEGVLERAKATGDETTQEEMTRQIRDLRTDLGTLRMEAQEHRSRNKELSDLYDRRFNEHRAVLEDRRDAIREETEADTRVTAHATEFQAAWTPAVQRAIDANKIPAALLPKFERRARQAALAAIDTGDGKPIDNLDAFLDGEAKEYAAEMDLHHREQSALYARGAIDRAAGATSTPAPGAPPVVAAPARAPSSDPLDDVYKVARGKIAAFHQGGA